MAHLLQFELTLFVTYDYTNILGITAFF